jgi:hypothetical protein
MDSNYFYPHNQPLNFTGNLPQKIYPYQLTAIDSTNVRIDIGVDAAKTLNINTTTIFVAFYGINGSWTQFSSACTVSLVSGEFSILCTDILFTELDSSIIYLCYNIDGEVLPDDYKRFLKLQIRDTAEDEGYLVENKIIEVAVNANYDYVFNANSYGLQYLESPKLVFNESYENSDNGLLNFVAPLNEYQQQLKRKLLAINVFDFTTLLPKSCYVGYQAQGWEIGSDDAGGSYTCLTLKSIDVYSWLNPYNQYYIWLGNSISPRLKFRDLTNVDFFAYLPVFYVSNYLLDEDTYFFNDITQPDFVGEITLNGVACIAPINGNPEGDGTDTPASYVAPLMYNLNTNVRPYLATALKSTRLNIKYPVLAWINLMGGLEYQQVNANEDGEGWYCKFGVRQNESVYYLDNDNRRNEIMNRGVVDTIQFNIVMKREATQESDRLAGLMVSKSVFIMYGFQQADVEAALVPAMRQLIISRKGFQRFESDTITRVVCDAEFSQVTDIKR